MGTNSFTFPDRVNPAAGRFQRLRIPHAGSPSEFLTISAGYAVHAFTRTEPPGVLVQMADQALYFAKQECRDRSQCIVRSGRRHGSPIDDVLRPRNRPRTRRDEEGDLLGPDLETGGHQGRQHIHIPHR